MEIEFKRGPKGFFVGDESHPSAEILFEETSKEVIIYHTEVQPALSGQGIGRKLVNLVTEEAKKVNKPIISYCSYADKVLSNDPPTLSWNIKK